MRKDSHSSQRPLLASSVAAPSVDNLLQLLLPPVFYLCGTFLSSGRYFLSSMSHVSSKERPVEQTSQPWPIRLNDASSCSSRVPSISGRGMCKGGEGKDSRTQQDQGGGEMARL